MHRYYTHTASGHTQSSVRSVRNETRARATNSWRDWETHESNYFSFKQGNGFVRRPPVSFNSAWLTHFPFFFFPKCVPRRHVAGPMSLGADFLKCNWRLVTGISVIGNFGLYKIVKCRVSVQFLMTKVQFQFLVLFWNSLIWGGNILSFLHIAVIVTAIICRFECRHRNIWFRLNFPTLHN